MWLRCGHFWSSGMVSKALIDFWYCLLQKVHFGLHQTISHIPVKYIKIEGGYCGRILLVDYWTGWFSLPLMGRKKTPKARHATSKLSKATLKLHTSIYLGRKPMKLHASSNAKLKPIHINDKMGGEGRDGCEGLPKTGHTKQESHFSIFLNCFIFFKEYLKV